jgi:rRNA-processing protein FCF1
LKVIFDSSFLMAVSERPTSWEADLEREGRLEPVLIESVERELSQLSQEPSKKGRVAKVALEVSRRFERRASPGRRADDDIVSAALELGASVATTDSALAETLKSLHLRVISLSRGRVVTNR